MALSVCTGCTTKYAVGLPKCPHCGSADHVEDGQPMPKITAHGGPSDKTLTDEPDTADVDVPELAPAPADEPEPEVEGGEETSPGTSSSTSTETPEPKSEPSSKPAQLPARKTASRSKKGQTDSSSAPSTDGGQTEATSETGSADDK